MTAATRAFYLAGPAMLLCSCAVAFAQEPSAGAMASVPVPTGNPQDYIMTLGPFGALVWGAYVIGKGISVSVNIKLDREDRALLERGVVAIEQLTKP
jgi:hypothetical protein